AARTQQPAATEEDVERSLLDAPDTNPEPLDAYDLPMVDPGVPLPETTPGLETAPGLEVTPETEELPEGHSTSQRHLGRAQQASFIIPLESMPPATAVALYAEQMLLEPSPEGETGEVGLMAIVEPLTETGAAG